MEPLGRIACRVIDEARLHRLRAAGLETALVEYCDAGLTPDNVLLLAARPGAVPSLGGPLPAGNAMERTGDEPPGGVLLELDPAAPASMHQRVASYLLEQRPKRFPALRRLATEGGATPAILCTGSTELLQQLLRCPLLSASITRPLMCDREAPGLPGLVAAVSESLRAEGDQMTLRVAARPRSIEGAICAEFGAELLAPAAFTHTLCVVSNSSGSDAMWPTQPLRYCLVPRTILDLPAWSEAARLGAKVSRTCARSREVAERWPLRFKGHKGVALLRDQNQRGGATEWVCSWADRYLEPGAPVVELRLRRVRRPQSVRMTATDEAMDGRAQLDINPVRGALGKDGLRASVLLCEVDHRGAFSDLSALFAEATAGPSPVLEERGVAVAWFRALRGGIRNENKWHRDTAKQMEETLGATRIELLHLLIDKDNERTAVFCWGPSAGKVLPASPEHLPPAAYQ